MKIKLEFNTNSLLSSRRQYPTSITASNPRWSQCHEKKHRIAIICIRSFPVHELPSVCKVDPYGVNDRSLVSNDGTLAFWTLSSGLRRKLCSAAEVVAQPFGTMMMSMAEGCGFVSRLRVCFHLRQFGTSSFLALLSRSCSLTQKLETIEIEAWSNPLFYGCTGRCNIDFDRACEHLRNPR